MPGRLAVLYLLQILSTVVTKARRAEIILPQGSSLYDHLLGAPQILQMRKLVMKIKTCIFCLVIFLILSLRI